MLFDKAIILLQLETFYAILNALGQLKPENIDKLASQGLDAKQAISLAKYIFKAFEMIEQKDSSKVIMI